MACFLDRREMSRGIAEPPNPSRASMTQACRLNLLPRKPARSEIIREDEWFDGVLLRISGGEGPASIQVDWRDAVILQIELGGKRIRAPGFATAVLRPRSESDPKQISVRGQASLHDLRQQRVLTAPAGAMQIGFDARFLRQVAEDLNVFDVDPLDELSPIYGKAFADPALHDIAMSMEATQGRPDRWARMIRTQLSRAAAAYLLGTYTLLRTAPEAVRGGLAPWQLRRAQAHIRADLDHTLHLQKLAEACGLSVSHFARAFRQSTGASPHSWLTRERMERAKSLMRRPDLTLADIALMCGYTDQSHFTRVFVKEQGTSPGRWRRQLEPGITPAST